MKYLHQILPLRTQENHQKVYKSQKEWRAPREQLTRAHKSKRLKQQIQGMHRSAPGPLSMY